MFYGQYQAHGHPHPQPPPLVAPLAQQPHYPPMQMQDPNQYPHMAPIYHQHNLFPSQMPSQMPYPPPHQHYFAPQFQPAPRFHPHPQQHQHQHNQQLHRPYVPQPPRPVPPPQQLPHHLPPLQQMPPRSGSLPPQEQHHIPQNTSYSQSPRTTPAVSTSSQPGPQANPLPDLVGPASPVKAVPLPPILEPEEPEEPEEPLQKVTSPTVAAARVPAPPSPHSPQSPTSVLSASGMNDSSYHVLLARPRLTDPSFRFAISYSARPPTTILEKALPVPPGLLRKMRTKRIVRRRVTPPAGTPVAAPIQSTSHLSSSTRYPPPATPASSSPVCRVSFSKESPTPSSSVTETTPATSIAHTPTPGSPLSTNTSISSMATPSSNKVSPKTAMNPPAQQEAASVVTPPDVRQIGQEPDHAEPSVSTPQVEQPKPVTSEPVKKPTTKSVAWGTKSFASLLKSPDSAPPSSASGTLASKSIPVSTQTGFSVPGVTSLSVDTASLTPRAHSNILQLLTSGTVVQSSSQGPVEIRPRGLVNTGNMCFANVVLQVLVYSPPFWRLFTELGKYIGNGPVVGSGAQKDGKGTPLTDAVVTFLREFKPPKPSEIAERAQAIKDGEKADPRRDSFVPSSFYAALKTKSRFDAMRSGHQEDAEEFLGFLLDTLHEELLTLNTQFGGRDEAAGPTANKVSLTATDETASVAESDAAADDEWQEVGKKNRAMITRTTKTTESAITALFGGKFRSVLRASGRQDSASVEQWRCLQLDIQPAHVNTIEDALSNLATPETVSIQARHDVSAEATKQMFIESLPPVLILHVKRFVYDPVSGIGKNGKEVTFGPELEIRNDLMSPAHRHGPSAKYKLYGVIYHHGVTATGGHYTLDVLHPNASGVAAGPAGINAPHPGGEGWVRFDDESVRRLKVEDVFGKSPVEDRVAYLLFYRRNQGTR